MAHVHMSVSVQRSVKLMLENREPMATKGQRLKEVAQHDRM